ncbi:small integral membrane protein 30 [Alligator mississippiensis]|uniref:small integral membrane protein 30 n=1 Tax=Alligator mississippiensis TaxID=8496 RepID=UPI002877E3CB|nr:small integral membrane protein 30 [Alligator mississippiensis]XP_059581965.1 small integral membrane protein 30 [Alligator mississippiensis]XP_059581966.1 small integral membrane protein 30 [Alligator mississippiensis]
MASPCKASDFFFILISLLLLLPGVEALDLGDEVALLLGLAVSVTGLCACLGWYARRRNGQL